MKTQITIGNDTITKGHCSSRDVRIELKDFPSFMVCGVNAFFNTELTKTEDGETKSDGTSLTEDKILKFYKESEKIEIKDNLLIIETDKYKIFVELNKGDEE